MNTKLFELYWEYLKKISTVNADAGTPASALINTTVILETPTLLQTAAMYSANTGE